MPMGPAMGISILAPCASGPKTDNLPGERNRERKKRQAREFLKDLLPPKRSGKTPKPKVSEKPIFAPKGGRDRGERQSKRNAQGRGKVRLQRLKRMLSEKKKKNHPSKKEGTTNS